MQAVHIQSHNQYITARIIFCGTEERNRRYALLMEANKPETLLYRAMTFLFSLNHMLEVVHVLIGTESIEVEPL